MGDVTGLKCLSIYHFRVTGSDREKKMNENLEGVGQILGNLKGMATNMGAEISRQNDQLDVIQGKVSLSIIFIQKRTNVFLKFILLYCQFHLSIIFM